MKHQFIVAASTTLLILPLIAYGRLFYLRPPRTASEQVLFPGMSYKRDVLSAPRPVMMHVVTIDLKNSQIKMLVTPGTPKQARSTSGFLQEFKMKLAINASYFWPFYEKSPWDYYPRQGDVTEPTGLTISNGHQYAGSLPTWPVLCVSIDNTATINAKNICPLNTLHAVSGREMLVDQGQPIKEIYDSHQDKPYARVAVGVDQKGEKLWLIIVDGKQPLYSEGLTKDELAKILAGLGVFKAINLDGGGSTTLVINGDQGTQILNAPIHAKLPMNERPVSNHLGFYTYP
jgi:exopolysaccharide biosynthesis protein